MNYAIVRYIIGYVLFFEAAFMVPPALQLLSTRNSAAGPL